MPERDCSELNEADLVARALGGGEAAPELGDLGARLAGIPHWERRALGIAGLMRVHGLGAARATQVAALGELVERTAPADRPAVVSPRDALLLLDRLRTARREEVVVILLDARHRP